MTIDASFERQVELRKIFICHNLMPSENHFMTNRLTENPYDCFLKKLAAPRRVLKQPVEYTPILMM